MSTLPFPDSAAKELSAQLMSHIIAEIKARDGKISFAHFMELALYAPQLGYYRNALKKFGRDGDFVTAPEISPLFSYCLANQCAQVLHALNGGDIVEFGAGNCTMAADILKSLKDQNQLPGHYYILELSAFLKSQQFETIQKKIPECLDRVVWLNELPEKPINGIVLANEVLDAMPVHQFIYQADIKECGVTVENNQLKSCVMEKSDPALLEAIKQYEINFNHHYLSEINLYLPGWIKSVSAILARGVVIILDYGFPRSEYYHVDRSQGTLMCHYRHYAHSDVFFYPGLQDITAHIDFTAVATAAKKNEFQVGGFTHQAAFLMNSGLLSFLNHAPDEKTRFIQHQQVLQLTLPSEMGELFKVMALTKKCDMALLGFQTMNQVMRL